MARINNEARITPSVLDRLLDFEPELSREAAASRAKNLRQLKQSVRRDLEWLLNTRQTDDRIGPELKELSRSLAAYGLPDFSNANTKNPSDEKRMRRALENLLAIFEPRLEDVTITLEPLRETERALRIRIDGRLKVDPAPEPVTFDTVLQFGSGYYTVRET